MKGGWGQEVPSCTVITKGQGGQQPRAEWLACTRGLLGIQPPYLWENCTGSQWQKQKWRLDLLILATLQQTPPERGGTHGAEHESCRHVERASQAPSGCLNPAPLQVGKLGAFSPRSHPRGFHTTGALSGSSQAE